MNELNEIVYGLLLGDGYIHKPPNIESENSNTYLATRNLHPNYIFWLSKLFTKNNIGTNIRFYDAKGGFEGSKRSSTIETKTYEYFRKLWLEWYEMKPNGKYGKTIPNDFEKVIITPTILLHWFLGDGYLVHLKGAKERVQFATDRYSFEGNQLLIKMLNRDIGVRTSYDSHRNRLKISKSQLNIFYNYLGCCPNEIKTCLGYKWE